MAEFELPAARDEENLLVLVTALRDILITCAEGGVHQELEYYAKRKRALGSPILRDRLPAILRRYDSLKHFWGFIKNELRSYEERRRFLINEFGQLVQSLEEDDHVVLGEYDRVGEPLGTGGFGVVWRYRHRRLGLDFAFKIFNPHPFNESPSAMDRFFREARILFKLNHPDIIKIYDVAVLGTRPYIRMELFESETLEGWWSNNRHKYRNPSIVARKIVWRLASAMGAVHEQDILHRDLKPSNILIGLTPNDGKIPIRIIDFGMGAMLTGDDVSRLTRTGDSLHTGAYIAPELAEDPKRAGPRADVYSLGAIWYFLLTGRPLRGAQIEHALKVAAASDGDTELICRCIGEAGERPGNGMALAKLIEPPPAS